MMTRSMQGEKVFAEALDGEGPVNKLGLSISSSAEKGSIAVAWQIAIASLSVGEGCCPAWMPIGGVLIAAWHRLFCRMWQSDCFLILNYGRGRKSRRLHTDFYLRFLPSRLSALEPLILQGVVLGKGLEPLSLSAQDP